MAKVKEKTPLKKSISQFNIVGRAKVTDNTFSIDNESQSSDWIYSSMQLGVDVGNGTVYSNLMGGYGATRDNVIYVFGTKKDDNGKTIADYENRFTIDWEDRFDDSILETIADDCFIKVGIEKDNKGKTYVKKFLSAYDAVEYLSEHLEDDTIVNISGTMQYQYYNESITVQKNIKSIYLSNQKDENFKATFRQTILLDNDSVEKIDKERNTYPINAYVIDYVGKVDDVEIKQNITLPYTFYFDVLDVNNPEKTKKILDKLFKPSKKDKILEIGVEGSFVEGGVISTATIDEISDDLRMLIELGMMTEEDALAKYTNGKKDRRMIIQKVMTKNDSQDSETKNIVIMSDEDKYTFDDLIFINQFLNGDDTDDEETDTETEADNSIDSDDEDWLKELMSE